MEKVAISYDKHHGRFIDDVRSAFVSLQLKFTEEIKPCGPDEQDGSDLIFEVDLDTERLDKLMNYISKNVNIDHDGILKFWETIK